jgi:hypothetical protein
VKDLEMYAKVLGHFQSHELYTMSFDAAAKDWSCNECSCGYKEFECKDAGGCFKNSKTLTARCSCFSLYLYLLRWLATVGYVQHLVVSSIEKVPEGGSMGGTSTSETGHKRI